MTICIAAICEQGSSLILASDTMLTNEWLSIEFEHPTRKMTRLSDSCIALTAGDALAYTELFNEVQKEITKLKAPSVLEIVNKIKECYQHIRKREIEERILNPRGFNDLKDFYEIQRGLVQDVALTIQSQIDRYDYGLEILTAGISGNTAQIYGISDPGTSKCFDAMGFHAIGSGLPNAINTLIARGFHHGIPLEEGLLIVYEAKKMAEKAPGVGGSLTDISNMKAHGLIEFPRDRFEELHKIYDKWIRREPSWADDFDVLLKEIGARKDGTSKRRNP